MYGDQFPLYFPECVAQLPLSGKDHIVVSSNLNFSGASLIRISPFFYCSIIFILLTDNTPETQCFWGILRLHTSYLAITNLLSDCIIR